MANLIDSRGQFWWSSQPLEEGHFAPDQSVTGHLSVSERGLSTIFVDGRLTDGFRSMFENEDFSEHTLHGILQSGQRVSISDLYSNGGNYAFRSPSSESFLARNCLVSMLPAGHDGNVDYLVDPVFAMIRCPLTGYDAWLKDRPIKISYSSDRLDVSYIVPDVREWNDPIQPARIAYAPPSRPLRNTGTSLSMETKAFLELPQKVPKDSGAVIKLCLKLDDLMFLFTDNDRGLDFPLVVDSLNKRDYRFFYYRPIRSGNDISEKKSWVDFPDVEMSFGHHLNLWLSKHEKFGPGFDLFLSGRRLVNDKAEYVFASYMWGLESFHRLNENGVSITPLSQKIDRILSQVTKNKDKSWLRDKLKNASEPTLEDRLSKIFSDLPIKFRTEEVKRFAARCAKCRNDLSHFGGLRTPNSRSVFRQEVYLLNRALRILYHSKLLQEIDVSREHLAEWLKSGWGALQRRQVLEAVNLHALA